MRGGPPSRGWSPQNGGNRPAGFSPAHIHLGRRSRRTRRRGYVASRRRVRQVSRGAPQELHAQDAGFAAVVHDTRGARARRLHRPHVPAAAFYLRRERGDDAAPSRADPEHHVERPCARRTHGRRSVQTPLVPGHQRGRREGRGVSRDRPALRRRLHDPGRARVLRGARPGRHRRARHPRRTGGARGMQERPERVRGVRQAEGRGGQPGPRLRHREPPHARLALHRFVPRPTRVLPAGHRRVPRRVSQRDGGDGARDGPRRARQVRRSSCLAPRQPQPRFSPRRV